jgi:O-methyltransferase
MLSKFRYIVSGIFSEKQKFSITLKASHVAYFFLKALKGVAPLWEKDVQFLEIYKKIEGRVLLDKARAYSLYQLAIMQSNVKGDYLELGAYRCGATLLLSAGDELLEKTIYIIDSFEGLPDVTAHDPYWHKGDMGNPNINEINQFLSRNLVKTKYKILKGFFPNQIDLNSLQNSWALVHLDTDLYKPTLDGLNFFYTKLSSGGVIIVDDFGNMSCPGVEKAVTEFCETNNVKHLFLLTGQALITKH